jgi:hypothetical protein
VAWVAEVSSTETEPQGDGAAVAAFEVYVVSSMQLAVSNALAFNCRTLSAEKLIFLELDCLLLPFDTVHHSSKVRLFALEACEVRHLEKSELLKFAKELIVRVFQSGVLVQPLVLGSHHRHLCDFTLNFNYGLYYFLQYLAVVSVDPLFAGRAIHEAKVNSRRDPFNLQNISNTVQMEHMTTTEH